MSRGVYVRLARHAGLAQSEPLAAALAELDGEPTVVAATLRSHQLVGLLLYALPDGELERRVSPALAQAIRSRATPTAPLVSLLDGMREAQDVLRSAGIGVRVLKGFALARRLYGDVAARPQYDVDLLVRRREFGPALRVLRRRGFVPAGRDLHSRTLERGSFKLDVHWCLRWAPAFRVDEARVWADAATADAEGHRFETLSEEWTLVLLALSAFEDLGQGMVKLRQLLDLYLYLRGVDARFDWPAFFRARQPENLCGITEAVFALTAILFEAEGELPRLHEALSAGATTGRERALDLVLAPRKSPENLAWFASVYPGSLAHYLAWFWLGGFPGNLRHWKSARPIASLKLALSARRR